MSKAIDDLKHEHEAITFTLKILGKMLESTEEGNSINVDDAVALLNFLKEFADKCHHGKEEGILFPALEKAGISKNEGIIKDLLQEHEQGRTLIREMDVALKSKIENVSAFVRAAKSYSKLLSQHIEKENTILFPMGEQALSSAQLNEIYDSFEEYEERVIGAGRHEELHAMLDSFSLKYLR